MSDFVTHFTHLQASLKDALQADDIELAYSIDQQRQALLRDYIMTLSGPPEEYVFDFIETCAAENAVMLEMTITRIRKLRHHAAGVQKVLNAYRPH